LSNSNQNCFSFNFRFQISLKTATERYQTERQIRRDAPDSAHTARVAQQCLYANYPQTIEKKQRPTSSPDLNHLEISRPTSDA